MLKKDWIKTKLKENNLDKESVYNIFEEFKKETQSDFWKQGSYERVVRECYNELVSQDEDFDQSEHVASLEANKQRMTDINNQLRKSNRETYRIYNSLEELYSTYIELLKNVDLSKFSIKPIKENKDSKCAILQLSDLHANELIYPNESFDNEYDFDILSKRMKKFISQSLIEFKNNNVSDCYVIMTGDLLNSYRRLSEKLAMATSITSATLLLTYILEQAIIELSQKVNVHITFCIGNESRVDDEVDGSNIVSSQNSDFAVFNNLRYILSKNKNVDFIIPKNNVQSVFTTKNGFNALITHGHIFKSSNIDVEVPKLLQQYMYSGIKINGVFVGHFHNSKIGDLISMSGSMCGGNSYSSNTLGFMTRASQNIYIINKDLSYKGIKIDLQNVDDVKGYDIIEELEIYNVKSTYNNTVTIKNLC